MTKMLGVASALPVVGRIGGVVALALLTVHCGGQVGDVGEGDEFGDQNGDQGGGEGGGTAAGGRGGNGPQGGASGGGVNGSGEGGRGTGAGGSASAGSAGASGGTSGGAAGAGGTTPGGSGGSPSNTGGAPSNMAGAPGAGGSGGAASGTGEDKRPLFSFFTVSQAGLLTFASDKVNGLGGDLGGLAGADNICTTLARRSNPGDQKTWRAFLSTQAGPVHAIERIGKGPWHDYRGRVLAKTVEDLLPAQGRTGGRPQGGDPALAVMFTDENGDPIRPELSVDNHDMLTGSNAMGRYDGGSTCNDWTSTSESLPAPMIGHAWPRNNSSGRNWVSDHRAGGCGKGIDTELKATNGTKTVGAGGGYGGFYCFAVTGM